MSRTAIGEKPKLPYKKYDKRPAKYKHPSIASTHTHTLIHHPSNSGGGPTCTAARLTSCLAQVSISWDREGAEGGGKRSRGGGEGGGGGRRQQTARLLCGRAAWPLALSPPPPLLLLLLLLSDDDRTEENREKQGRVGLGRTVLLIGKTTTLSYSSRNAVTLHKFLLN